MRRSSKYNNQFQTNSVQSKIITSKSINVLKCRVIDKRLFVKLCSGVRLNVKGKSPLAAMTCESTQRTLGATAQYGTFVLAVIQLFAAYNCRKRSTIIK